MSALSSEYLVLKRFYSKEVGQDFHLDREAKTKLVNRFKMITSQVPTATSWLHHVVLAEAILNISPKIRGDVIECGCWKGGSTASLSLVCELVGRKLVICDSFQGLPRDDSGIVHRYPHLGVYGYYREGMYSSTLEEVKHNIEHFGNLSVCQFVPGFFSESLKVLSKPIVFAFLDVDLASSMKDCIKHIWPLIVDGGMIYTDDSCDMEVVKVWFNEAWWKSEIGATAPGYVGSGCGLPLNPSFSSLGYAQKVLTPERSYKRVKWLYYPDTQLHSS